MDKSGERRIQLLKELRAYFGDENYHDLPFESTLLAMHAEDPALPPPYMVTHGYMFEAEFLVPNGQVHALRFCRLVEDFIRYYSHITGFCTCPTCDSIYRRRIRDVLVDADTYVRRYSPMHLFLTLEEMYPEEFCLQQSAALLVRCRNFGLMEPAHAQSLLQDLEQRFESRRRKGGG